MLKSSFKTGEFWLSVAALASSVITLAVLFGYVKPQNEESLTKAISAVIAALGAIAMQWGAARGFSRDRTELKKEAIKQGLSVDEPELLPGLEEKMSNMKPGEELTFVINGVTICLSRP